MKVSNRSKVQEVCVNTTQPDNIPVGNLVVKVCDVDLHREKLLGEAITDEQGHCKITYTKDQLSRPDKDSADLQVRVFTEDGTLLKESEVRFHAKEVEKFEFEVELSELTEFENLLNVLAPALHGLSLEEITEEDTDFLLRQLAGEPLVSPHRLKVLTVSSRLASDTGLPKEFIFGIAHATDPGIPLTRNALLSLTDSDIRKELDQAIKDKIVSQKLGDSLDTNLARIRQLRLEEGLLVRREIKGRLLNEETGKPLSGFYVQVVHLSAENESKDLGSGITNKKGQFSFSVIVPSNPSGEEQPSPALEICNLKVLDQKRQEIYQYELEVDIGTVEVLEVKVPAEVLPKPVTHSIDRLTTDLELQLPEALKSFLAERKIYSLEDIRLAGGLRRLDNLPLAPDHPAIKTLEAHSNLSVVSTDVKDNAILINNGFDSLVAIATKPREKFAEKVGGQLGAEKVDRFYVTAKTQFKFLTNLLAGSGISKGNGRHEDFMEGTPGSWVSVLGAEAEELFPERCDCPDCESAVSPLAYLADLLTYTLDHVTNETPSEHNLTVAELSNLFHQPFGDLPASCQMVDKQVRQVRLCVEVLRKHLGTPLDETAQNAYCLSAYTTLLLKIGTSYEELRLAHTAEEDTRRKLANRLGIERPDQLDVLLLDPGSITEASLERLFGLADTTRDPLSDGLLDGDTHQAVVYWQFDGVEWGWNTDSDGIIYLDLSYENHFHRVDLYRDSRREELVAKGRIESGQGTISLIPENESNLAGIIQIDHSRDSRGIRIRALPQLLCWRLQYLRALWKEQDGACDRYSAESHGSLVEADLLPVIDPDLIGPDDFRNPFPKSDDTVTDSPFDIWICRRQWVDLQLDELRELWIQLLRDGRTNAQAFESLLERMHEDVEYRGATLPASWPSTISLADFKTLSENLKQGKDVEATEQIIRKDLKLTVDSFNRLREIQIEASANEEILQEEFEELISILVQACKVGLSSTWRKEESIIDQGETGVLFGPKHFWKSLKEPVEGDWPPVADSSPLSTGERLLIDPDIINKSGLPEATAGRRALAIWEDRRAQLDEFHEELKVEHAQGGSEGFNRTVKHALGDPPSDDWETYLTGLLNRQKRASATGIEDPEVERELRDLHLSEENLTRMMEIHGKEEASEGEWGEVFTILASCYKELNEWPAEWLEEEQNDPLLNGNYWLALKAKLPKWRASAVDRFMWQRALHKRSELPIIDPDLISREYLRQEYSGPAADFWQERSQWITDRLIEFQKAREQAPTSLTGFDSILVDNLFDPTTKSGIGAQYRVVRGDRRFNVFISETLNIKKADLDQLLDLHRPLPVDLPNVVTSKLDLSATDYRRILQIGRSRLISVDSWDEIYSILAKAILVADVLRIKEKEDQGGDITSRLEQLGLTRSAFLRLYTIRDLLSNERNVLESEWEDVDNIIIQARKTREFGNWQQVEQERSIILSSDLFKIPELPPLQFPPPEAGQLPAWRANRRNLRNWEETLESRIDQAKTTIAALSEVVSATEEETLPELRNDLIAAIDTSSVGLANNDMSSKAKYLTSSLLIDTQNSGCLKTTRISQAIDTIQGLLVSLRSGLLEETHPHLKLSADDFDEEWKWIGSYATWRAALFVFLYPENLLIPSLREWKTYGFLKLFEDLRNARELTPEDAREIARNYSEYVEDLANLVFAVAVHDTESALDYIFCRGPYRENRALWYFSTFDAESTSSYPQSSWVPIPQLESVTELIDATIYNDNIYLFAHCVEDGNKKLMFTTYDLTISSDWSDVTDLELPEIRYGNSYSIAIMQSQNVDNNPPCVVVHTADIFYKRQFNSDGTDWEEDEWQIIALGSFFWRIRSAIEVPSGLCLVVDKGRGRLFYRFLGYLDDGSWRKVDPYPPWGFGLYDLKFAFLWPASDSIYIYGDSQKHGCKLIRSNDYTGETIIENYPDLVGRVNMITSGADAFFWFDLKEYKFKLSEEDEVSINIDIALWLLSESSSFGHISHLTQLDIEQIKNRIKDEIRSFFSEKIKESPKWKWLNESVKDFTVDRRSLSQVLIGFLYGTPVKFLNRSSDLLEDIKLFGPLSYVRGSNVHAIGLEGRIYHHILMREEDDSLISSNHMELNPIMSLTFSTAITDRLLDSYRLYRHLEIKDQYLDNDNVSGSVLSYLNEAFYFVPLQLALYLHKHGQYIAALDWFKTVYDYSAQQDQRKISYFLTREESADNLYERASDWLLDPINPHDIACFRCETYTRFTLLAIVRCFLDYADSEFSKDTAESVPRARELYNKALELLNTEQLQRRNPECEKIIGEIEIEIGKQIEENSPESIVLFKTLIRRLHYIQDFQYLSAKVYKVKGILTSDESWEVRLENALDAVTETETRSKSSIGCLVRNKKEKLNSVTNTLLSLNEISDAASKIEYAVSVSSWLVKAGMMGDRIGYSYQPGLSFVFCIPPNPMLDAYRLRAELNLYKIRTCRNIAGMERELEPYAGPTDTVTGLPQIGTSGGIVLPGTVSIQPTPYRFQVLLERAKQLVQLAAQIEVAMLSALEKRDVEYYQVLKARQDVQVARQVERLQKLRVKEAEDGVKLAELQRERSDILIETYQEWLDAGLNKYEWDMLDAYERACRAAMTVAGLNIGITSSQALASSGMTGYVHAITVSGLAIGRGIAEMLAAKAEEDARSAAVWASHERRKDEWILQKRVAEHDIRIGNQQVRLSQDHLRIVGQEHKIAEMQTDYAQDIVEYLSNKFTNVELYDWMSGVLEGVYSFFLQQAAAMAKLAENQIAFERQEIPPAYIQADYWETRQGIESMGTDTKSPDRHGLTGSARLLQDIYQLDDYAFKTDQRKLQLSKTVSLAHLAPPEFQQFRETGVMIFETPMEMFDRGFPGHYLRLIKRVHTSVIALIPPVSGIHATLSATGLSSAVIGGNGLFQQINIRRLPESIALSSPANSTGLFELLPESHQQMLFPFEGMGVDAKWEFRMPKAGNQFDFDSIADVLITIEYTALDDFAYRRQVIRELDDSISADRPFSFRHQFADQWYDLHNPDQTAEPMIVRFETRREDFPPNVEELRISQVMLYFSRTDGATFEVPVTHLHFTEQGSPMAVGGEATTLEGIISTGSGSVGSWITMLGQSPIGEWELALPNTREMRNRFANGEIEDILFVITYSGQTPPWPE